LKKSNLFIVNSIIIMISSLFIEIICAFFDIYLANKIGAKTIGIYGLIMSIYMFTVTIATSGINLAATKVVSEEVEKNNISSIPNIIKSCFAYSFITSMLACILLVYFTPYICDKWLMNNISHTVLYTLAISLPFVSMTSAISGYFLAVRNAIKNSASQVIGELMRIGVTFILVTCTFPNNINYSALALIIGNTLSDIISFIYLYIAYLKDKQKYISLHCTKKPIAKRILKISLPIALTSYIRSGLNTLKQIIIPIRLKFSGMSYEKAIAQYGIISGMAMPIIMFPSVIVYSCSSLLIPEFSRYSVHNDKKIIGNSISKIFKTTLYFSIAITGIFMYFGKEIGAIIYNISDVGWYIKIIAPLITLIYLDNVIDSILKGLGKQVSVMCCNILDLIISVSFIYYLLPIFGSIGYIIVMYISEILNYSISVITLFKETNIKFKYFEWVILPTASIIVAILITKLFSFSYLNSTLSIILKILLCVLCYVTLISFIHIKKVNR